MVLLVLLIMISSQLSWWVSIWICVVITEVVVFLEYSSIGNINCGCDGVFVCDEISCGIMWLSIFISGLSLLRSGDVFSKKDEEIKFLAFTLVLMCILVICFSVNSLLLFYVFFELRLIPTFLIICGWGYQPERLRASKFMVLYTVSASLPLLAFLLCFVFLNGSVRLRFFESCNKIIGNSFVFLASITAFLVKAPMYGLHTWLPKAHVEAPVAGSMMLAGVLLKLGRYGLARFMPFFSVCNTFVFTCVICLCIFGGVAGRVICCFQTDIKSLVAYSSVGHISLVLCGLMRGSLLGFAGAYLLMVAHGLRSPGIFFLVREIYKLFGSRRLIIIHGIIGNLIGINLWLALMCGFNAAAPPSLRICGEVALYVSLIRYSLLFSGFLGVIRFLSCLYSWVLYCNTQTGNYPNWVRSSKDVSYFYFQRVVCGSLRFFLVRFCAKI